MAMACRVFITFAASLRPSLTSTKGIHRLKYALGRLSQKENVSTAQKVLDSCRSQKQILSVDQHCQHHSMTCLRFVSETFSYNLDVVYCTSANIVIYGYWVGPDIDDGWGFVEAVINQMT